MYVGGGPSECSRAVGYARNGLLAQMCPQNIVLLQKQGGDVYMRAACARIHSGVGNTPAVVGEDDSEGEWYGALVLIYAISDDNSDS